MRTHDVPVVGTGHGGAQTASALRQAGLDGTVAMIGEEAHLACGRPALFKAYLAGGHQLPVPGSANGSAPPRMGISMLFD